MTNAIDQYATFMGGLREETLPDLPNLVAADIYFRDPFNAVTGVDKMQAIFQHMYDAMGDIRFDILHAASTGEVGMLHWCLNGKLRGNPWNFEGMSKVEFNTDGLVVSHMDHWDAAQEFYEHFPVIGWSLKAIRNRIAL